MLQSLHAELLLRIIVGAAFGALIGFERDLHGRPAGLRTHTIVALASATFMVVSSRFVYFQHYEAGDLVTVDPSRIAASVVSGIGFLGAGAILRTGLTIRGLTTAAGLWLVAAIGMAAGAGMYVIAAFVTAVGLSALTLLRRFEDRGEPIARQRVTVLVDEAQSSVAAVTDALTRAGAIWTQEEFERPDENGQVRVMFDIRTAVPIAGHVLAHTLQESAAIKHIKIERL
ncbi:MAG TPA: MgtC/SapB family protein [Polyangia bacterium]|jgi:putative Mg2+ transporter-C (MgtC) family protein|nr:MgtC/SapB family protein [Polyangia bacterium]